MKEYILYRTHKGANAKYIIKSAEDKPPCACMWVEYKRFDDLMRAIAFKTQCELNPPED